MRMARTRRPPKAEMKDVKSRVEKRIKKASEFDPNQNMLIYGPPDSFKTRTAASAPKVLVIDCDEKGTDSVRRDIDPYVLRVEFWNDLTNDIYWYLQSGDHDYESVAIDGVTGAQTLAMAFVLGDEAARDASRDPDMPSRQVWQKVGQLMKTMITNYRNLEMNTVFTALARSRDVGEGEDDDPVWHTGPNVSPSIASHLEAAVGTIGYMMNRQVVVKYRGQNGKIRRRKEVRRRMLVGPQDRYTTKDRNGLFGEYVDAPNLAEMLAIIQGKEE